MSADLATDCDACGEGIAYGFTAHAVPTGTESDGLPVVRILCADCYRKGAA